MKPLVSIFHAAMSIRLGSKNVLNLAYFAFFKTILCLTPGHIPIEIPPGVGRDTKILRKIRERFLVIFANYSKTPQTRT